MPRPSYTIRFYLLGVVGFRYGLLALGYWVGRERLTGNAAHTTVEQFGTIGGFAIVFGIMAVLAVGGALFPRERATRILLWASMVLSTIFGVGLFLSWTWSPALAAFLPFVVSDAIFVGKDYTPRPPSLR